jgi:hypothetical protein
MKIGVGYSAFNGIELLEHSIKQIRNQVDFIVVSYQEFDWFGKNKISTFDLSLLKNLKDKKLIDELIEFKIDKYANNAAKAQYLEAEKRKINREKCLEQGMTYFLDMDVDEFYKPDEFKFAKEYIKNNNIDYSVVEYINYFKLPIFQCRRDKNSVRFVPFICKIIKDEYMSFGDEYCTKNINGTFVSVDKTRFYDTNKDIYLFNYNQIMMHHMTGVRKDLMNKFTSYSGKNIVIERNIKFLSEQINNLENNKFKFDKNFKDLLFFADNMIIITVPNVFNIPMKNL